MAVEKITPQLVKKGKGKKRPGYRGPGGYQGGASSRGGPPGGGATAGGSGRDFSRGPSKSSKSPSRSPRGPQELGTSTRTVNRITAPPPTTRIGGKTYDVTPETRGERQRAQLKQQLMRQPLGGNKIDKFGNTKKNLFRGGGGIGSLLASLFGMAMGIPGLGLLTGGFGKLKEGLGSLNDKIQSTDFARSTSLMDYLDAKKYGGIDERDIAASKNMREAKAIQTAMGMRPTTIDPREMARMGLQMPTAPRSKPTFSDPFANTVGTTTKVNTTNDAVSSNIPVDNLQQRVDVMNQFDLPLNYSPNDLQAAAKRAMTQPGMQIELAPYEKGVPQELQFFDGRPFTAKAYDPYADGGLASMFTRRG